MRTPAQVGGAEVAGRGGLGQAAAIAAATPAQLRARSASVALGCADGAHHRLLLRGWSG
ncbi:hypothetical protein NB693_20710 [Pantoea ananatis]|uniref:hypothetical protein n=1 Tax=Pantoea ananas TaxID=553 RepID=UPI0022210E0B|nr:hypothetical protein [Pantoea ananatis]